ncbi:MAG: hypothetical protein EPN74_02085 [Rhodanobacter sp.]|nr:MAG: hypothetical protein EPN74_02085 [Rhodanobacter sp.]
MSKFLMKTPFFGYWLTVDELHGYGTERATLSLRERNRHGQPGKRVGADFGMKRAAVIATAFELLDIADKMLPSTTFATSDTEFCTSAEPIPCNDTFLAMEQEETNVQARCQRAVNAFSNLRRRLPTLQRLQRLLEQCDDDIAATMDVMLLMLEQTGDLPFRASVGVVANVNSPEGAVRH